MSGVRRRPPHLDVAGRVRRRAVPAHRDGIAGFVAARRLASLTLTSPHAARPPPHDSPVQPNKTTTQPRFGTNGSAATPSQTGGGLQGAAARLAPFRSWRLRVDAERYPWAARAVAPPGVPLGAGAGLARDGDCGRGAGGGAVEAARGALWAQRGGVLRALCALYDELRLDVRR